MEASSLLAHLFQSGDNYKNQHFSVLQFRIHVISEASQSYCRPPHILLFPPTTIYFLALIASLCTLRSMPPLVISISFALPDEIISRITSPSGWENAFLLTVYLEAIGLGRLWQGSSVSRDSKQKRKIITIMGTVRETAVWRIPIEGVITAKRIN